jgi:aminomethyltransferase
MNAVRWPVQKGSDVIGWVTSAVWSPRLQKNIGYAMLPVENAIVGTRLIVAIPQIGARQVMVVPRPFIDPTKSIPKA